MKVCLSILIILILTQFGCKEDDSPAPTPGKYANGVWVLNQGDSGESNGSIGFYSFSDQVYTDEVYRFENGLAETGDLLQSMFLHEGVIYIVANGDNKILRMKAGSGEALPSWEFPELDQPRYILIVGQEVYISNWGPYNSSFGLDESFILRTDRQGQNRVKIACGPGPEGLAYNSPILAVPNSFSNVVEFVNVLTNTKVDSVVVETAPNDVHYDPQGDIWINCSGGFGGTGYLLELNKDFTEITSRSNNDGWGSRMEVAHDNQSVWVFGGRRLLEQQVSSSGSGSTLFTRGQTYGVLPLRGGGVWYSDPLDFKSKGRVYRLTSSGMEIDWFFGGIAPNQFIEVN